MKSLCVTLLVLLFLVSSSQAAAVFLEDFEGPPTAGTLEDDLGWTRYQTSAVGYGPATYLGTSALNDFKGANYHVKPVPGLVDDLIVLKFDMYADGLYNTNGGEGQVGINDGTDSSSNAFLVGPGANPANPGYPGAGGGGWFAFDGLNDTNRINIMDGGSPGVGNRFLGGVGVALTVVTTIDQVANTISIDILRRSDLVSLNPTFVIPLTPDGKTELQACTHVNFTAADYYHNNPDMLQEVDNISLVSTPEPATMMLLGLGGLTLLRRRRG